MIYVFGYIGFTGTGGVAKAVGTNIKLPPGLMAKAKKEEQEKKAVDEANIITPDANTTVDKKLQQSLFQVFNIKFGFKKLNFFIKSCQSVQ